MEIFRYFDITHIDHHILNPMNDQKLDELVELLDLPPGSRLLDIGCGKAELLIRACRRWGCRGMGLDLSSPFVAEARKRVDRAGLAESIGIVQQDGATYAGDPDAFDVVACLGASFIWGGFGPTLKALGSWTRPGGLVLSGEPYWRQAPDPAYCEAAGVTPDVYGTHAENVQTILDEGLTFLYAMASSEDDWDRYEGLQSRAAERFACAHPDDPDVAEVLARCRHDRDSYLRWGRNTLGWAIYVLMKAPESGH